MRSLRRRLRLRRRRHNPDLLHVCPDCGRDYVIPVAWEAEDDEHWWIALRCGECGYRMEVVVGDAIAKRFDRELDNRMTPLQRTLRRLEQEHMRAEADALIAALQRDLINPSDFAR
jgi:hypothetical protein